jgi:hypothetical protein
VPSQHPAPFQEPPDMDDGAGHAVAPRRRPGPSRAGETGPRPTPGSRAARIRSSSRCGWRPARRGSARP